MMNQAASATRRPAGSTTTAGCCPMFNTPFFVNTFAPQAPLIPPPVASRQCFLGPQATQIPIPSAQPQQQNVVLPQPAGQQQQQQGVPSNGSSNHPQQPQAPQQQQPQRPQDHPNTYSTSPITAPALSLQHLLASRHSASNCMALAAALASASFPHFQQLQQAQQQQQQQHHQTPINQSTNTNNTNVANPPPLINANTTNTATNQVPMLNFNSYNVAQSFLNMPAPTAPPATAHLNLSNNNNNNHHHQQSNSVTSTTSQPTVVQPTPHANTGNIQTFSQQNHQHRPLATNTTLNSAANQQHQPTNYRNNAPVVSTQPAVQAPPVQQLGQVRNVLSDEALNSLFNDQFQAILLNQLFANHRYAPPVTVPAPPQQQQAQANSTDRPPQQQQPLTGPAPVVMPPAQQVAAPIVPQPQQQAQEQVSGQQPAFQSQQQTAQPRLAQVPTVESYTSSGVNAPNGVFPPQQQHTGSVNHHQHQPTSDSVPAPPQLQAQQPIQQQQPPPPQQQPQSIPQIPFYSFPQMEQALALLTNPQVANNIFSHVFNIYFQSGMRTEPHHTHHHHHPPHHFHHHLHGSHHHHHHHHGPNGQGNGQDVTMPLDSLAISESKPRGLNRAEIDSLTPYIHMNEKDSRTCVICLSKFELKSKIRPLPCNHAFHAKCVDKWLRANRTCPICRRDALKTYGAKIKRI